MTMSYSCHKCGHDPTANCCDFAEERDELKIELDLACEEAEVFRIRLLNTTKEKERYKKTLEYIFNNSLGFHLAYDAAHRALYPEHFCEHCDRLLTPDDTGSKCECCGSFKEDK